MAWGSRVQFNQGEIGWWDKPLLWVCRLFCAIALALWLLQCVWLAVNVPVRYTYFNQVTGAPLNHLESGFYQSEQWRTNLLMVLRVLLPIAVVFGVIMCDNFTGLVVLILAIALVLCVDFSVAFKQTEWWTTCNSGANQNNPCNSRYWCSFFYTLPNAKCGNTAPFFPPLTKHDLRPDFEFQSRYYVMWICVGVDALLALTAVVQWLDVYSTSVAYQGVYATQWLLGSPNFWVPGMQVFAEAAAPSPANMAPPPPPQDGKPGVWVWHPSS